MNERNEVQNGPMHAASVGKRMGQGAGMGLLLIVVFLLRAGEPDPDWPKLWIIKPLLLVPLVGALGGVFYYNMDHLRNERGWHKALANILSLLVYLFVLWMGTVLGLSGTMWD